MSTNADPIRIHDLTEPVLSPEQKGVLEFAASLDLRFDADAMLDEARCNTGLDDFGADDFRPRLRAHIDAIGSDTGLTGLGRLIVHRRVLRLLSSRLALVDLLDRYPEIHEIELAPPVIVVGLPRSGTTHLVNLLAADTRFRSLPFWESLEPFPHRGEGPGADGFDPRYQRCLADYDAQMMMAPLVKAMHHQYPAAIEEEIELLDLDFASYTLEWHARVPSWRDFYLTLDQTAGYEYLKTALKALTFLRGPRRWVLKSPQHLEQLGPLSETFPDATIAFTHRDPVAVIQSAITMLAYGDRIRRHEIDPGGLAAYWTDRVETLLRACVRDRDLLGAERSTDVLFHEFMADDVGTVARIFDRAGLALDKKAQQHIDDHMAENPRGKHGRIVYDLAGDFGIDPGELRDRFAFYFERFPIKAEA